MKKQYKLAIIILIVLVAILCAFIFTKRTNKSSTTFFYDFSIKQIPSGWSLVTKENSAIAWFYDKNGSSISIRFRDNSSKEIMSEDAYNKTLIEYYLKTDNQNRLLSVHKMNLFNSEFNTIRMKFNNIKYGMTELIIFYKRTDKITYIGTISFPYKEGADKLKVKFPEYVKEMMDCITFKKYPFKENLKE